MTVSRRIRRRDSVVPGAWPEHVPALLRRVHAMRGALDIEQAQPRLAQLLPPDLLSGIDAAIALLVDAIDRDQHIVVVGDFDCDGATACAVGVRGLRMLGARRVSHAVPNRMVHGYGLTVGLVDDLAALQPDLLVTVDHGIACHAGIAAAKARGWRVLVTDHHLAGDALPPADAIVDPNQPGDAFPSKMLAGVGVIFYVLLALRARLRQLGRFDGTPAPDLSTLLDLVAIGTVADLVPLDTNNRALVAAGLRRLRAGQGCAGLNALAEVAGRDVRRLCASDIGFGLAPRINAAGRLEDMAVGIACLLSDDAGHARELAATLHRINGERRAVQQQMTDDAEIAVGDIAPAGGEVPPVLCLYDARWHPGVVGLVASKLKERHHRPAVAFAPAEPGSTRLRGSARSIPGLHIRDVLAAVDTAHPGLIERFGGHAMAAGLSLAVEALPRFQAALGDAVQRLLDPVLLRDEIASDGPLEAHEFTRASADALRDGGPWGQGYPEPLFDGEFELAGWRIVGERHLKLELLQQGRRLNAIEFGGWSGVAPPDRLRLAFRLEADEYRGGDAVQLVVVHRERA
ncbi:single-stranded-DNA-specific exonuclease RecJ [Cognatiluteimonas telluris]|jgi:single-stranded-DNA-specific exonuclease|uniref:single-stranded-DNA-specific exonuclease RecJ n=1 Tax=Cognatiluteimonas telluris TaxID=1104775 RepID=UPI001409D76E|nr:single-stranded-DNA-specific exonuclease RecJ [Lysobacter telluris]